MFLSVANLYPGRRLSFGVSHTKGEAVKASREGIGKGREQRSCYDHAIIFISSNVWEKGNMIG